VCIIELVDRQFVVCPGPDRFPIGEEAEAISTMALSAPGVRGLR